MEEREIMTIFTKTGAYHQGHFKLSSGLHSPAYLQCAIILADPILAERLCGVLARKIITEKPDIVIGPAMGGIVLAYELARAVGARAMFTERDKDGKMALRRGFRIRPQDKVIVAEDVITTGGSVKEVIALLKTMDVETREIACFVDRAKGAVDFGGISVKSLLKLEVPTFTETECPLCQEGIPIQKPGSKK
ncbi:MAG: orotate phosphoribosyltransferase [Candidatus Omnitrophica bacterium]|nr:orotate phosphoribosyltransferase [Candidatus Omnitrophota bacterium]MDD4013423.1 orotate phosphoribosyltransferase [Candidatus Omnitrophota bacterium]